MLCFTQFKQTTQPRKPFTDEWLDFSGQDARKAGSGQRATPSNKKDFLVRLSSLKDELAHRAPKPLKPKNVIVRQTATPMAGNVKG
ncbi:hypothetical protein [Vibrio spartinae]|uniref:hypothetical protein n=1 Tax=Vibrio spartinae TaxID=1918945 RepID=UPI000942142A|nr:hypothetical protein [Vibrio spartinae]